MNSDKKEINNRYSQFDESPTADITHEDLLNTHNNIGSNIIDAVKKEGQETRNALPSKDENIESQEKIIMDKKIEEKIDKLAELVQNSCINKSELEQQKLHFDNEMKLIKKDIDWFKYLIPLFLTLMTFFLGYFITTNREMTDKQISGLEERMNTQLNKIKELDSMQIERDVAQELLHQKRK